MNSMATKLNLPKFFLLATTIIGEAYGIQSVSTGLKNCSVGYPSCLREAEGIHQRVINQKQCNARRDCIANLLKNKQSINKDGFKKQLRFDLKPSLKVNHELIGRLLDLIDPNDIVIGCFDPVTMDKKITKFISQCNHNDIYTFLDKNNQNNGPMIVEQYGNATLKEKLINYLNQALVEMRDQYLTQLMGGPTY